MALAFNTTSSQDNMLPLPNLRLRLDIPLPLYSDLTHLTQPCFSTAYVPPQSKQKDNTQEYEPSSLQRAKDSSTPLTPTKTPTTPPITLFEEFYNMSRPSSPTSASVLHFTLTTTPFSPILNDILQTPTYLYSPATSPTFDGVPVQPITKALSRSFSHPHRQPQTSTRIHRSSSFNSSRTSRYPSSTTTSTLAHHPHPQPKEQREPGVSQSPTVAWAPTLPFSVQPLPCHGSPRY